MKTQVPHPELGAFLQSPSYTPNTISPKKNLEFLDNKRGGIISFRFRNELKLIFSGLITV
jgi:hypothetical protein